MIRMSGKTHQGKRPYNEDFLIIDTDRGIGLVADGMGGHEAGEVASELAARTICESIAKGSSLIDAILATHREVIFAAHDGRGKPGMGTTVAVVHLEGRKYSISWVGDSRVYLWNGELLQLTRDHSYLEAMIAQGALRPEDASQSTQRNLVTQALGVEAIKSLEIKVIEGELGSNEQLLICTDGLNDELSGPEIAKIMSSTYELDEKADELVTQAIIAGGRDNVTVVLIELDNPDTVVAGKPPPCPVSIVDKSGVETFAKPSPIDRPLVDADADAEKRAIAFAAKGVGAVASGEANTGSSLWWFAIIGLIFIGVVVFNFM